MTRDDIIRMAAEAGFIIDQESRQFQPNCISHTHHVIDEQLTRFAELVIAAEREACAQVCDDWPNGRDDVCLLADAIRARGEK